MSNQNTIKKEVSYPGIALHTGVRAHLTIHPAEENTGIVFRRVDVPEKPSVLANAAHVVDVRRGTTIADSNGAAVSTVEHVMAALTACHVDNALVDMDGPEPSGDVGQTGEEGDIGEENAEAEPEDLDETDADDLKAGEGEILDGEEGVELTPVDEEEGVQEGEAPENGILVEAGLENGGIEPGDGGREEEFLDLTPP